MDIASVLSKESTLVGYYGLNKAFVVWAMGLYLNESDLLQLANDSLTDDGDDKKIDFFNIDEELGVVYIAQGFFSAKYKESAPANKASDLNCAAAWLTNGDIEKISSPLKELIKEVRTRIADGQINTIELIYVHNCGESIQVKEELKTAAGMLAGTLAAFSVEVTSKELGMPSIQRMYTNQAANIVITDEIECPYKCQYEEEGPNWKAAVMTISGAWLRELYARYSNDLFSANYRGYLGRHRNGINTGIKTSAEKAASHFWAYNNGITVLTNTYDKNPGRTVLHGISIINGAQTTGTIANIPTEVALDNVKILTRIIACADPELIGNIVKYNNTQNRITAWDGYGNDSRQADLQKQFAELGYEYNFKRGFDNRDRMFSIENSIQPLISFNGKYKDANRSKTAVFESRSLYDEAFENSKARHILFVYCINSCIQRVKIETKKAVLSSENATAATDRNIYEMFAPIKTRFWFLALLGELLPMMYSDLADKKEISLMPDFAKVANYSYEAVVEKMYPFVRMIASLTAMVVANRGGILKCFDDNSLLSQIAREVENSVSTMKAVPAFKTIYDDFKTMVSKG